MLPLTANQYAPFFETYINYVPAFENFEMALNNSTTALINFAEKIPNTKENFAYENNKWSIKQVFQHINDTERVMTFRALVSGRGDNRVELCRMDENLYAKTTNVATKTLDDILQEFIAIRLSTKYLYRTFNEEQLTFKTPTAAKWPISAKAVAYIIIGHAMHHCSVVNQRYLL